MFSTRKSMRSAMAGIGLAAVVGVAAAGIIDSSGGGGASASATTASATIRAEVLSVRGQQEPVLVDEQGMPLYYYGGDTGLESRVTGDLARAWPPLTAASVTGSGVAGKLAQVEDNHGRQVAYNGHLLYTFVSDRRGVVTGQGVQSFYVVTPGITVQSAAPATTSGRGSGY